MNCVNLPNPTLLDYVELCNLYVRYNQAWFDFYLNLYKFYLPRQ